MSKEEKDRCFKISHCLMAVTLNFHCSSLLSRNLILPNKTPKLKPSQRVVERHYIEYYWWLFSFGFSATSNDVKIPNRFHTLGYLSGELTFHTSNVEIKQFYMHMCLWDRA